MAVDFDNFLTWAKDRFGETNVKTKATAHGTEIMTHSFYAHQKGIEDTKFHLWMNPSGGKSKHPEKGSFRCWKTDAMGSLVSLVAEVDGVSFEEAEEMVCGATTLAALAQKVDEFFDHKSLVEAIEEKPAPRVTIELPPSTYLLDKLPHYDFFRKKAKSYLDSRKLPTDGLYVCKEGDYKNRLVIPYFNYDGELIWYNARLLHDRKDSLRYMKCKADGVGITQEDVLYMTNWPRAGGKVYIMEGELDALSLKLCGFTACGIGGKSISDVQIEMLRMYEPVLAFDTDDGPTDWGLNAMIEVGMRMIEMGFDNVRYIRPPKVYKDWNKLLVKQNPTVIQNYIKKYEKPFTPDTPSILLANRI